LGQFITLLAAPVLTRLYLPDDYGVLAVYSSILAIIGVMVGMRYEVAIPLPEDDEQAYHLLTLCLTIAVGLAALTALLIPLAGKQLTIWLNAPRLLPYLWLLPLGITAVGIYLPLSYWTLRRKDYRIIAQTRLSAGISQVALQLAGGVAQVGPIGLMLGVITGQSAGIGSMARLVWGRLATYHPPRLFSWTGMSAMMQRYRRFPLISSWATLLSALSIQLPILLLSRWYGLEVTGWFALSDRFVGVPLNLVSTALAQFYLSEAAETNRAMDLDSTLLLGHLLKRTLMTSALIGLPFLVVTMLGPWIFPIVFGPQWLEAGRYAQPLGFMYVMRSISRPTDSTLDILERQDLHLGRELLRIFLLVAALIAAVVTKANALAFVTYLSIAGVMSYFLYILISGYAILIRRKFLFSQAKTL
jgi:O-antigen/teichoic acid export membrane protein